MKQIILVAVALFAIGCAAPTSSSSEDTGSSSDALKTFHVVDHSDPIPVEVFEKLVHFEKLTKSDLDKVYRIEHDIDVASDRTIHATESFTLRSWLAFPHKGIMLIPGPVTNAAWFNIPVDGYDSGAILSQDGYFSWNVDLEGVGQSSFPANGQVCDTQRGVDDLTPVMQIIREERWVPKVDVLGESWGGGIATELCALNDARSCVLSSMLYKNTTAFGAANFLTPEFHAFLDSLTTGYFPTTAPFYLQFIAASPVALQNFTFTAEPGNYADASLYAPFSMPWFDPTNARVPALVLYGDQDPTVDVSDAQDLVNDYGTSSKGSAKLVVLTGAGHVPRVETAASSVWWSDVLAFLHSIKE
jgi:pimeloyl-ACP methyl ester carboxylesterase